MELFPRLISSAKWEMAEGRSVERKREEAERRRHLEILGDERRGEKEGGEVDMD